MRKSAFAAASMTESTATIRPHFTPLLAAMAAAVCFGCRSDTDAGEVYYTGFENFTTGFNTIVGTEGWLGSAAHVSLSLSGVDAETTHGVSGLGNAAFIGGNAAPLANTVSRSMNVRRPVGLDPVALNEELVTFRCLIGFKDSSSGGSGVRRDDFEIAIYNNTSPSQQLLAAIQFDNSTIDPSTLSPRRQIFRTQWNASLNRFDYINTNATFLHDTIQLLSLRINYRTNRWTMELDGIPIFSDLTFHGGTRARTLGAIAAQLQIVGTSPLTGGPQPGDNYMLFDDWTVRTDPLPAMPPPGLSRNAATGAVTLTWDQEAGYRYQIGYAASPSSGWLTNLPGSLVTATASDVDATFTDTAAAGQPARFYRITRLFP